jgi:hypothetical protein
VDSYQQSRNLKPNRLAWLYSVLSWWLLFISSSQKLSTEKEIIMENTQIVAVQPRKTWVQRNLPTLSGLAVLAVGSAHAALDTTGVTSALTDAGTAVATVGAAVLVVYVGIKTYKMIKSAL